MPPLGCVGPEAPTDITLPLPLRLITTHYIARVSSTLSRFFEATATLALADTQLELELSR
jgi:hypothetical protein